MRAGNVCSEDKITGRDEMKEKLDRCFKNYQPREEQSKQELFLNILNF